MSRFTSEYQTFCDNKESMTQKEITELKLRLCSSVKSFVNKILRSGEKHSIFPFTYQTIKNLRCQDLKSDHIIMFYAHEGVTKTLYFSQMSIDELYLMYKYFEQVNIMFYND